MTIPPTTEQRRSFESELRARSFIVGLTVFYACFGIGVIVMATNWTWLLPIVVIGAFPGCLTAQWAIREWRLDVRERLALRAQLAEAAAVVGWGRRTVQTVVIGLLVVDLVAFLTLWLVAVAQK